MRSVSERFETTRRPQQSTPGPRRGPRSLLTIAFHPELRRIGEQAVLAGPTALSRLGPVFRTAEGRLVGALSDPFLSRTPLMLTPEREAVVVHAAPGVDVRIEERPVVGEARVPAEALRHGVTLTLAGRVLLLLHSQTEPEELLPKYGLVGESAALQRVREEIGLTAALAIPVLLRGESGTGKELVARAIHASSPRASQPYVALNMAALNPQTAVAELFGHTRGSFTGAVGAREGYFRDADGGTLFLDEIGEASLELQAMLLRVLESGEIQPVGGTGARRVDVRVIAATDARIEDEVRDGGFRLALLHRLAGYTLHVPPLRERRDDIPRLLIHFLAHELRRAGYEERLAALMADASAQLGPPLIARLLRAAWPGNVRQLGNAARQMAAMLLAGRGLEGLPDFGAPTEAAQREPQPEPPPQGPGDVSDAALIAAMQAHRWNVGATARALKMSRSGLYARMDRCPGIRKAAEIPAAELRAAYARHDGDLEAIAAAQRVSLRGLQMRLRQLKLA